MHVHLCRHVYPLELKPVTSPNRRLAVTSQHRITPSRPLFKRCVLPHLETLPNPPAVPPKRLPTPAWRETRMCNQRSTRPSPRHQRPATQLLAPTAQTAVTLPAQSHFRAPPFKTVRLTTQWHVTYPPLRSRRLPHQRAAQLPPNRPLPPNCRDHHWQSCYIAKPAPSVKTVRMATHWH